MTLALLLTAVTGAWAADTYTVVGNNSDMFGAAWDAYAAANDMTKNDDGTYSITYTDVPLAADVQYKVVVNRDWGKAYPADNRVITIAEAGFYTLTIHFNPTTHEVYETMPGSGSDEPTVEVTTNAASAQDLFTEASFTMPAFDATVNYMLVRDMQDEANPVTFSGLPSSGNIVVKKGSDGKYQPAEALTIQLIDPLAAAEAQNIIAADGITVKVLVGNGGTPIEYDQENPITLEAFLADMKPGYYWIKAESTDENSPYDGTVYSSEFTVVEQYDLTVKPANDFSKGKVESVTVGTETVTPDATTGEATKTGITPDSQVKLKAKRGYVIEKVEAKKAEATATTITIGVDPNGHSSAPAKTIEYTAGETWAEVAARYDWLNTYDVYTVYHTDYTPGNLKYVDSINGPTGVKPSDTVDPEKTYHWGD